MLMLVYQTFAGRANLPPTIKNMTDTTLNDRLAALLSRASLGDKNAFADLYEATKSKLFAVSLRIVRERHIAEEVLQDSFVKIWNHAADYAVAKSAPMTWMTTIVRNRSLDIVRRPNLEIADDDDFFQLNMQDESPAPPEQLAAKRDEAHIVRCMKGLEGEQHKAISLAFFQGLSHTEVAEKLDKPLGTVKTHIRRGLLKLKDCLDGHVNEGAAV
jgi:RNA polymerase sigma-70 factor, ECF subfamily